MPALQLLLVNDSRLVCQWLAHLFVDESDFDLSLIARNGQEALRLLAEHPIDVVLLDLEMPVMDGFATLSEIRLRCPHLPVLILSRHTQTGAQASIDALLKGASDYLSLPEQVIGNTQETTAFKRLLCSKIQQIRQVKERSAPKFSEKPFNPKGMHKTEILVVGASTGGPRILEQILSQLPTPFSIPILIVQHIGAEFVAILAQRLSEKTGHDVKVAAGGESIGPGQVWLAPYDYHLKISPERTLVLDQTPLEHSCRPAVDALFRSAASIGRDRVLGIILTGMGYDGLAGARAIHEAGGTILAQDNASSAVWGMPRAVVDAGLAAAALPPKALAKAILHQAKVAL